jgi:hypothetical protein
MVICPLCMNLAQAWLQDAMLKAQPAGPAQDSEGAASGLELGAVGEEARLRAEAPSCDGDAAAEGEDAALLGSASTGSRER